MAASGSNIIEAIVDPVTQADPTFRSKRLYSPLSAGEVHRRLQIEKGYKAFELPTVRTISNKLTDLGMCPQRVKKCKPIRKIAETNAIFARVHAINAEADKNPHKLRLSLNCKSVIKNGSFSRSCRNRIEQNALDHDFEAEHKLVPFGIFYQSLVRAISGFPLALLRQISWLIESQNCGRSFKNDFLALIAL